MSFSTPTGATFDQVAQLVGSSATPIGESTTGLFTDEAAPTPVSGTQYQFTAARANWRSPTPSDLPTTDCTSEHTQHATLALSPSSFYELRDTSSPVPNAAPPNPTYSATTSFEPSRQALWRLGESTGTTATDAEGHSPGTYVGSPTLGTTGPLVGDATTATTFDGSNYVRVPHTDSIDLASTFTVEGWVNPTSVSSEQSIFSTRSTDAAGSFQLELGPGSGSGSGRLAVSTPAGFVAETADGTIPAGQWSYVAYTRSSPTDQHLFVNGAEVTLASSASHTIANVLDPSLIGAGTNLTGNRFVGRIADVGLYSSSLSAGTLAEHEAAGLNRPATLSGVSFHDVGPLANDPGRTFAVGFNGTSSTAVFDTLAAQHANGAVSVSAWVKWDGTHPGALFSFGSYQLSVSSACVGFTTSNSDCYGVTASSVSLANTWHHVVATFVPYDASASLLTVDGSSLSQSQISGTPDNAAAAVTGNLTIAPSAARFGGDVAELAVFPTRMSGAASRRLYKAGTTYVVDGTAPATPSPTAVDGGSGTASVSWSAISGAVGYDVYRDSSFKATVSSPSFSDAGLLVGSTHTWSVVAFDTVGNQSAVGSSTITLGSQYAVTVLADTPSFYARLGESSGTSAVDASGGASGTYHGGFTLGSPGGLGGDASTSVALNGTSGYVTSPLTTLSPTTSTAGVSLEVLANPANTSTATVAAINTSGSATNNGERVAVVWSPSGHTGTFGLESGSGVTAQSTSTYTTGSFHHVVLDVSTTASPATASLYVDGQLAAGPVNLATADVPVNGDKLTYGASLTGTSSTTPASFFNGSLDEATFYRHELGAAAVAHHAADTSASGAAYDATTNLSFFWRLGDPVGSTSAFDSSGNGLSAAATNVTFGLPGALAGDPDTSAHLDGTSVLTGTDRLDATGTAGFSLATWVRPDTASGTSALIDKLASSSSASGWSLQLSATTGPQLVRANGSTSDVASSGTPLSAGTWYFVVGTYDGTTLRIYANGVEVGRVASSLSLANRTTDVLLGASNQTGGSAPNGYAGRLDETAGFTTTLNASQIAALYAAGH